METRPNAPRILQVSIRLTIEAIASTPEERYHASYRTLQVVSQFCYGCVLQTRYDRVSCWDQRRGKDPVICESFLLGRRRSRLQNLDQA